MAGYRKIKANIPLRDETMLVRQPVEVEGQQVVPWDMIAPGLYPDEELVKLNTGETIAVSIEPEWLDNNAGVAIHGFARWINDDGSTRTDDRGRPVETSTSPSFDHGYVELHGVDALVKAVTAIVLGEEQDEMDVHVDPAVVSGEKPQFDPAQDIDGLETADPARSKRKVIDLPRRDELQGSIRSALDALAKTKELRVKV